MSEIRVPVRNIQTKHRTDTWCTIVMPGWIHALRTPRQRTQMIMLHTRQASFPWAICSKAPQP